MLKLLDYNKITTRLKPITTPEYFSEPGRFHIQGVFSESIFGPIDSPERRTSFSYVNLNTKVIHPAVLEILKRLDRRIIDFIATSSYFKVSLDGTLDKADSGFTGITSFIGLFPKIKFRGETPERDKLINLVQKAYKEGLMFIDKIMVIPPDFRPAYQDKDGNWVIDTLNDLYVGIIRKAEQLKSISAGEMFDILSYSMQQAISDHYDFLLSKIGKKRGLVRSQLLGKRVDFSGRAVIVPDPKLSSDQVGVPIRIAIKIFEPFIIHILLYSGRNKEDLEKEIENHYNLPLSVDLVRKTINAINKNDEIPETLFSIFWDATEISIQGRVVICKRDPVLHPESVRAFYPVLTRGDTIQISPAIVGGFNADFDGDQMAIYHPLTNEAQKEAKERLMNIHSSASSRQLAIELSKEMYAGLYIMTKDFPSTRPPTKITIEDIEKINNPYIPVIFNGTITTSGKAVFNSCLPKDYPFINERVDKKVFKQILNDIQSKYSDEVIREVIFRCQKVSFKFSTIMAPTFTIDDIEVPKEILDLKDKLEGATPEEASKLLTTMETMLKKHLKDTGLDELISSGAGKGWSQSRQILIAKGIVSDAEGNILPPIKRSFSEGLDPKSYLESSYGARSGMVDRVINTADTGYFSRILVYVLNSVELNPTLKDCKTDRTVSIKLTKDLIYILRGRYIVDNRGNVVLIDTIDPMSLEGKVVKLRTPIYCKSKKICQTCYGLSFKINKSPYIGILAAQSIGERGTQLIMRTFHTGGAVEIKEKDILGDIVKNDPDAGLEK